MQAKVEFFASENTRKTITKFLSKLRAHDEASEFGTARNAHIERILSSMANAPAQWDESCQINISWVGNGFLNELASDKADFSKSVMDDIFSTCFRFLFELYLSTKTELALEFDQARRFAQREITGFDGHAREQIEYALREMPISIFKQIANSEEIGSLKNFIETAARADQLKAQWEKDLSNREERVARLRNDLEKYESAFNFVGLHQGFEELSAQKEKERKGISFWLRALGVVAVVPVVLEIALAYMHEIRVNSTKDAILIIVPTVSFVFISIYYFRVLLHSYQSVKTQLLQIDLRKTLCRFIQHYSEYAAEMKEKDKEALSRFEELIFSGIVSDGDRLPSAYDGIDQVAKLIKAVKSQ